MKVVRVQCALLGIAHRRSTGMGLRARGRRPKHGTMSTMLLRPPYGACGYVLLDWRKGSAAG